MTRWVYAYQSAWANIDAFKIWESNNHHFPCLCKISSNIKQLHILDTNHKLYYYLM